VSETGLPARFDSEKLTDVAAPPADAPELSLADPPPASLPETAAVAVNNPAVAFAVKSGELATPLAPVVALASVAPPVNVAPALAELLAPHAPGPPEASANATVAPATGLPFASSTLTCSGWAKRLVTFAERLFRGSATILAGRPAGVFVRKNDTEPNCELAVTV
jgi:hypothetical protein